MSSKALSTALAGAVGVLLTSAAVVGSTPGAAAAPPAVAETTPASPDPTPTEVRPTTTSPPTPTATPHSDCARGAYLSPFQATITAQQPLAVRATSTGGTSIELVASDAAAGSRTIRTAQVAGAGEHADFVVYPVHNTTLKAPQDPENCTDAAFGDFLARISVASRVSIQARRNATRDYTFSGQVLPARAGQLVEPHRKGADGARILTARATTTASGAWSLQRRFTGAGRFDFVAGTRSDQLNAPGSSNTRSTLIY